MDGWMHIWRSEARTACGLLDLFSRWKVPVCCYVVADVMDGDGRWRLKGEYLFWGMMRQFHMIWCNGMRCC
jgi:hypothetical protein